MTIKEKYPQQYLDHWIAMFSIRYSELSEENCIGQISLYKEMEGEEEFQELQNEIQLIIKNKDVHLFLPILKDYFDNNIKLEDFDKMLMTIVDYRLR